MLFNFNVNDATYSLIETLRHSSEPARYWVKLQQNLISANPYMSQTETGKMYEASLDLIERTTRTYLRPEFNISKCQVGDKNYSIKQKTILDKPFANLVHFEKKNMEAEQPPLLIVAPMAGHYATLCRGTIEGLLPYNDVYITDWHSASEVPLSNGQFTLDEYVNYLIEFIEKIGPKVAIMAVCQPTVPVLAMVAYLSEKKNYKYMPSGMILVGGPIDARKSPTAVNKFAISRDIEWFRQSLITKVPLNYPGAGRSVYPGYLQLIGFMSMNMQRHLDEYVNLFKNLVAGNKEAVNKHKKFYDEYLAVMDLPAEFYLQTIEEVFQKFSLPEGKLIIKNKQIKPENIKDTALLVIEGELDDISGLGQTKIALDLCKNIKSENKHYHMQKNVGHYGVFSGSKFKNEIALIISDFTKKYYNK